MTLTRVISASDTTTMACSSSSSSISSDSAHASLCSSIEEEEELLETGQVNERSFLNSTSTVSTVPTLPSCDDENDNNHAGTHTVKQSSHRTLHAKAISTDEDDNHNEEEFNAWVRFMNYVRHVLTEAVTSIATVSATHPKKTAWGIVFLSFAVAGIGLATNFKMNVESDILYTPKSSRIREHQTWVVNEAGFPAASRNLRMIVHNNDGQDSVMTKEAVEGVFEAIDTVRNMPGYDEACSTSDFKDVNGTRTCNIRSVAKFWNNSVDIFRQETPSDVDVVLQISKDSYPDRGPVIVEEIMGNAKDHYDVVVHADAFFLDIALPADGITFEYKAVDQLLKLRDTWSKADHGLGLELLASSTLEDETTRAVYKDIPLVPMVFVIMSLFCCFIFSKRDKVKSRSLLGLGAVICVALSLVFGYGLMFLCGVNFTFLSQILPFVMFGIGLDDTFIIIGSYTRTDPRKDTVERIQETMRDIGLSIILTTVTTSVAFGLGCISEFPALYWLSFYAFTTMITVFFFSITFFVALIALDEKRIQENRRDCLVCLAGPAIETDDGTIDIGTSDVDKVEKKPQEPDDDSNNIMVRFMDSYSDFLMKPFVKAIVLVTAVAFFVFCAYSTSKFRQEFNVTEMLPSDSYAESYIAASEKYGQRGWIIPAAYFRNVDQSDEKVQQQMEDYVNDLVGIDAITTQPPLFWLRHFKEDFITHPDLPTGLTFNQQLDIFLGVSPFRELYSPHIVRDPDTGDIVTSRVVLYMDNIDVNSVDSQIKALNEQRAVSMAQPVNDGAEKFNFFCWEHNMFIWDFYRLTTDELKTTTIVGVITVCLIGFAFVPHWSSVFFIFPLISVLYIDLMAWLQMTGNHLNVVSYFSLIMSVGLLVDFLMHMLLRYHESPGNSREEKVKAALKSMGVSILVGGLSTMLGVLPLAFSTSNLMRTVFVGFFGMVALGLTHGLIVLPVLLSMVGPTAPMKEHSTKAKKMAETEDIPDTPRTEATAELSLDHSA